MLGLHRLTIILYRKSYHLIPIVAELSTYLILLSDKSNCAMQFKMEAMSSNPCLHITPTYKLQ